MRVLLPVLIVLVMLVAMVAIAFYGYQANRRDAGLLTDELLEAIDERIAAEVDTYLAPAGRMLALAEEVAGRGAVLGDGRALAESLGLNVVEAFPQLYSFLFADPNGNFMMLKRSPGGPVDTWHIERRGSDKVHSTWTRRDESGQETGVETSTDEQYDPRARPWYKGAVGADGIFWTDAYVFFTDRSLGVTASLPVRDASGELHAVLAVDILLGSLSEFLDTLEISENGIALIVDDDGGLIAYPDLEQMVESGDGDPRRKNIYELGDKRLDLAFDRFRVEKHGRRRLELDGTAYVSIASSLAPKTGRDWSVLIVAPESDFLGFVSRNNRNQLFLSGGVLGLAALLAILMAVQGLRADHNAHLVGERQRQFEAQSDAYTALSTKATLFDEGDAAALLELTEVMAQALEVRRVSVWRVDLAGGALVCDDCYDSESGGHTQGVSLMRDTVAELWSAITGGEEIVAPDARSDRRVRSLYSIYLEPLGCSALAAVPVRHAGRTLGAVWLEDEGPSKIADAHAATFARTVANMLALRLATDGRPDAIASPVSVSPAGKARVPAARRTGDALPASVEQMRRPDVSARRAELFLQKLDTDAWDTTHTFAQASVLVLKFTNVVALGQRMNGAGSMSAADHIAREAERLADEHGVPYVKLVGDHVVCAAGLEGAGESAGEAGSHAPAGVHDLADFSLALQKCCVDLFAALGHHLEFRIGADLGPALGSTVGGERAAYNIWGDAVTGAAVMADTGTAGCVQVSQSIYEHLSDHYLFRLRGRYYAPDIGETATYLLTGRV